MLPRSGLFEFLSHNYKIVSVKFLNKVNIKLVHGLASLSTKQTQQSAQFRSEVLQRHLCHW